jgi:hypothetical protein
MDLKQIATMLGGFGAGYSGQGGQYLAGLEAQKQGREAESQRQQMLSEERKAAMIQDAYGMLNLLNNGKVDAAVRLGNNRLESINKLGGDPSDTQEIMSMITSGDPAQFEKARQELGVLVDTGMAQGYIKLPEEAKMTPYQQAQIDLKKQEFDYKKQNPNAGVQPGQAPASIQEINYYKSLPEGPEKEAVGRKIGMVSREGMDLSAYAEKQLDMASTEAATASADAGRYMTLADQIKQSAMSGGLKSTWTEYIKEQSGNQDEVTGLRKQVMQIVNSEAVKNLPPGPATDRDIEMVRSPFPTEKASPEYVANWLSAVARLNEKRAQFAEFKANFISENGSLRTRSGESLISSWKKQQESQMQSAPTGATQGIAPPSATGQTQTVNWADL